MPEFATDKRYSRQQAYWLFGSKTQQWLSDMRDKTGTNDPRFSRVFNLTAGQLLRFQHELTPEENKTITEYISDTDDTPSGNGSGQVYLALKYRQENQHDRQNRNRFLHHLHKAVDRENPEAMYLKASLLKDDKNGWLYGYKTDPLAYYELMKRASDMGHIQATDDLWGMAAVLRPNRQHDGMGRRGILAGIIDGPDWEHNVATLYQKGLHLGAVKIAHNLANLAESTPNAETERKLYGVTKIPSPEEASGRLYYAACMLHMPAAKQIIEHAEGRREHDIPVTLQMVLHAREAVAESGSPLEQFLQYKRSVVVDQPDETAYWISRLLQNPALKNLQQISEDKMAQYKEMGSFVTSMKPYLTPGHQEWLTRYGY